VVESGIMGDSGAVISEDDSEDDMLLSAGGGRVELSGCEIVGDTSVNGVERGEKVRAGER
jgi:hypothetical protein